jgi:membrane-bound lytic murein transglycosylase B
VIGRHLLSLLLAGFAMLGGTLIVSALVSSGASAKPSSISQSVAVPVPVPSIAMAKPELNAAPASGARHGNAARVSPEWASATAAATGIPQRALVGYAGASLALGNESPQCHLGWSTLAALGWIESGHGTHAGSRVSNDGVTSPGIFGPALDGTTYAAIEGANGGPGWDRALGPLQFIASTWATWGADGNGDSVADPQQIDDAALSAGRYLCHYGDLSNPDSWRTAVFAYNHVTSYVDAVAAKANDYNSTVG